MVNLLTRWSDKTLERLSEVRLRDMLMLADLEARDGEQDGFAALDAALDVLEQRTPRRYRLILKELRAIHLTKLVVCAGQYRRASRTCRLDRALALRQPSHYTASAIVHEATHARLMRLGIPYDESIRDRVELACDRESLRFLEAAGASPELVDSQRSMLGRRSKSDAEALDGTVAMLRARDVPEVVIRGMLFLRGLVYRLRMARRRLFARWSAL